MSRLHASYRVVNVPYEHGIMAMYDAAIRHGVEIVWHENRPHAKLCLTPGAATRRARRVLQDVLADPWTR